MAETRTFELFDYTKLSDASGGVNCVRTYRNCIIPFLRTPEYDTLMCLSEDVNMPGMQARRGRQEALRNRIARGELHLKGIIPSHVLEKTHGGSDKAIAIQMRAVHFLGTLVQGGANVRIATPDAKDTRLLNSTGSFDLIEYQDGRPGELVVASPAGSLSIDRQEPGKETSFDTIGEGFETVWEDPSTIAKPTAVAEYLFDIAGKLEERLQSSNHGGSL